MALDMLLEATGFLLPVVAFAYGDEDPVLLPLRPFPALGIFLVVLTAFELSRDLHSTFDQGLMVGVGDYL